MEVVIAWVAAIFGINSTHKEINKKRAAFPCTISIALLVLLIPNILATHAIAVEYRVSVRGRLTVHC